MNIYVCTENFSNIGSLKILNISFQEKWISRKVNGNKLLLWVYYNLFDELKVQTGIIFCLWSSWINKINKILAKICEWLRLKGYITFFWIWLLALIDDDRRDDYNCCNIVIQ